LTLQQWCQLAAAGGFDTVLLAEHEETGWTADRYATFVEACREASTDRIRLVPGVEFNQDGYHVLCYGLRQWVERPCDVFALADAVRQQGSFLCLAHPPRYRWKYPDSLLAAVDAVEVWNSSWVCDGRIGPHPASLSLAHGKTMLVGQDVHKARHMSGLIMETPSDDVVADLQQGQFVVTLGHRRWTQHALQQRRFAGVVQQCRTAAVRSGLRTYRWSRRRIRLVLSGESTSWRQPRSSTR
jgi:hypothetical protein